MKYKIIILILLLIPLSANVVKAQTEEETADPLEWYFNPPHDYSEGDTIYFSTVSWGGSYDEALAEAIWNIANKIIRREAIIVIDSIEVTDKDFEHNEKSYADIFSETYQQSYSISYRSGNDQHHIDIGLEGDEYIFSNTVTSRTHYDGYEKFISYIDASPKWIIKEKEIKNDRFYLLLEYRFKLGEF